MSRDVNVITRMAIKVGHLFADLHDTRGVHNTSSNYFIPAMLFGGVEDYD